MICPVCSADVDNNHSFCEYCGAQLESNVVSNIVEQSELTKPKKEKEMIFNIVFAIFMIWNGVSSSFGSLSVFATLFFNSATMASIVTEIIAS